MMIDAAARRVVSIGVVAVAVTLTVAAAGAAEDPVTALGLTRPSPVRAARDFQLATPTAGQVRLSDFKGKVVVLNFWATWCKPCEEEMPSMERLYQRLKERGLVVVAISMDADGAAVVRPFVEKHKLTFPVALDPRMTVSAPYGVWALPATFIIDRGGRRVLAANGPREWDSPAAETLLQSMLK